MAKGRLYKWLLVLVSLIGLTLHLHLFTSAFTPVLFLYFTVQSNLAVLSFLLALLFLKDQSMIQKLYRVRGYILLAILLTGILNWFFLGPMAIATYGSIMPLFQPSNFFVHGLIPILFLIDWYMFDPKKCFKSKDVLLWTIYPLIYMVFIVIRGYSGEKIFNGDAYPYPFLNPTTMGGITNVVLCILVILIAYLLLGKLIVSIDNKKGE